MKRYYLGLLLLSLGFSVNAQVVGTCHDQVRQQSFYVYSNLWMEQVGFPQNAGQAMRDPSGMMFLRVPAVDPMNQAFFIDWYGNVVEFNRYYPPRTIGACQWNQPVIPQNPFPTQFQAPEMASWGVRTSRGVRAVPAVYADQNVRYTRPLYASAETAQECLESTGQDESQFADCMLQQMLDADQRGVYDCAKASGDDPAALALCVVAATGGSNERQAAQQISNCYQEHGSEWDQYPLCMASQNMNDDGARLLGCIQSQSRQGDVSVLGTAVCYGAESLRLNPEQQIAIECAATSGGEPMAFAGCAGGRLTARELTKCLEQGVGGDGCFGPNNEIVKALRNIGIDMENTFGENNDLVRTWNNSVNDLQNGPGPNNDAVRAIETISNDLTNGPGQSNDIVQALDSVVPGFKDLF